MTTITVMKLLSLNDDGDDDEVQMSGNISNGIANGKSL